MSLPAELRHWVQCPYCNEIHDLKRVGKVGVRGTKDSKLVKCGYCGKTFRTTGGTIWENMGRDGIGDTSF